MTNVDLTKVILTYVVALVVIIGGLAVISLGLLPPEDDLTKGAIIGFIGIALNWTFGESTRSSTARQTTRALQTNPTVTTTSTDASSTVTTSTPPETPPEETV